MSNPISLTLIVPSLRAGGAERVMSFLARSLDKETFHTTLLVIGDDRDKAYETEGIAVKYLRKEKVRAAIPGLFRYFATQEVDVVMSTIGHLNTVVAGVLLFFPKIRFAGRETYVMGSTHYGTTPGPKLWDHLKKFRMQKLVCQSEDMKQDLKDNFGYPEEKLVILHNPVTSKFQAKEKVSKHGSPWRFITIGRLATAKGHSRIFEALAGLDMDYHYTVIGSGPLEDSLKAQAENLRILNRIKFIPYTAEIPNYLANADIYLQGSFVEGFPNALLESLAVGTPAVVFNAPGGINEIMMNGKNGYIAESVEEFQEGIRKLASALPWDPMMVRQTVTSRYSEEKILEDYQNFFINLASS